MDETFKGLMDRINEQEGATQENGPLPYDWGILYAPPNPDGSRKQCGNCIMWSKDNKCTIHSADVEVTENSICGYHVFGNPMPERMEHEGMMPVTPALSGLEVIQGGTSCDICMYHFPDEGKCLGAVGADGKLLDVEPKGCCSRWEPGAEV